MLHVPNTVLCLELHNFMYSSFKKLFIMTSAFSHVMIHHWLASNLIYNGAAKLSIAWFLVNEMQFVLPLPPSSYSLYCSLDTLDLLNNKELEQ